MDGAAREIRKRATRIYQSALRCGWLTAPAVCEECGSEGGSIHGHHDDYNNPLMVRWLCGSCHGSQPPANPALDTTGGGCNMETHANRLRMMRALLGVGQTAMAARLGVSRAVYARWESLKRPLLPPSPRLVDIREQMGCSLDWLLTGEGQPLLSTSDRRER
jgi:ribosomal protein S27AE